MSDTFSSGPAPIVGDVVTPAAGSGRARLSDRAARWIDGGPLETWAVVHGRFAKPVGPQGQQARFMFTRVASTEEPVIASWSVHQRLLVDGAGEAATSGEQVFWRLAVRQRAIAIDAEPRADLRTATERARLVKRRAAQLRVALGFFAGEPIPSWVILNGDMPLFVGLPQHHLVPTSEPRLSLASLLAEAQVKAQVHEVGPRTPAPRTPLERAVERGAETG